MQAEGKRTGRRWLKRALISLALIVLAGTLYIIAEHEWVRDSSSRDLSAALAETDRTDPGWRWDDLCKSRAMPPPGQNSADLVPLIVAYVPGDWQRIDRASTAELKLPEQAPNLAFLEPALDQTRDVPDRVGAAVELARTFKAFPNGNRAIQLAPNVFSTLLPNVQGTRTAVALLRLDIIIALADGNNQLAADNLLAQLNVSRSIGDEPFAISQLVRLACRAVAARSLEWALAQTELSGPQLAALQEAWAKDAEEPLLWYAYRGERAISDVFFRGLENGTVSPDLVLPPKTDSSFKELEWWRVRARLPREHAFNHRWMSRAIEIARLPIEDQPAAVRSMPPDPGKDMPIATAMQSSFAVVTTACWRSTADARCVAVALACERYRLRTGQWPESLAGIPSDLLPVVPLDPVDGKPLRYRRLTDGVAIYSVGPDGNDDGGDTPNAGNPRAKDQGLRLWNKSERGKTAPEEIVPAEDR